MANFLYNKAKEDFLSGNIDLENDDIKAVLVDSEEYTPDQGADEDLADVPSGGRIATTGNLTGKTVTDGVFDADDETLLSVTGDQSEALVIYKDSGVEGTSRLIAYIDTATGLPITPNGGNIAIAWANDSSKIFKL